MGAQFDGTTVRADNPTEAIKLCYEAIANAQWESGHGGYTGTLAEANGVNIVKDKVFTSINDAWEYLEDTAQKWGPALGVRVEQEDGNVGYVFGALCSS
jgi:hypothetical protein